MDRPELTPALLAHLAHKAESLELPSPGAAEWSSYVLVTPRFGSSRHIAFLLIGNHGVPDLVVKLARIAGDDAGILREANNLRLLAPRLGTGEARVPRVRLLDRWNNRRVLVEEALNGAPIQPERQLQHAVDDTLTWLRVATAPSGMRRMVGTRYVNLVVRPLRLAARVLAAAGADAAQLHAVAERTLSQLRGSPLPLVFEHGHLGFQNVIRLRQGGIGVIDWEDGRPDGVPLSDLVFFLTRVAEANESHASDPQATVEELMAPGSWGRDTLEAFALDQHVPPRLVPPLIVLSWTRRLAAMSLQLDPGLADASAEVPYDLAASVARHRYRWLWESALRAAASEQ